MLATFSTTLRLVYGLLGPLRGRFHWVALFSLANGLVEMAGVVSLYPFLMLAGNPEMVHRLPLLEEAYRRGGFASLPPFVALLGGVFVLLYALANLGNAWGEWLRVSFSSRLSFRLSRELLRRYARSPYAYLLSRHTLTLLHQATTETSSAAAVCNRLIETMIRASVVACVCLALLTLEPVAALTTAAVVVLLYSQIYRVHRDGATALGQERARLSLEATRAAAHLLGSLKESRAFPMRDRLLGAYEAPAGRLVGVSTRIRLMDVFPRHCTELLAIVSIVAVLIYLVLTGRGPAAVPSAGVFVLATWRLVPCLQDIYGNLIEMRAELPVLERVARDLGEEIPELPDGQPGRLPLCDRVRLDQVSFTYPGCHRPALDRISLELPRNTTLALVGRTGSGKTTLADVIAGFHQPTEGEVRVDGALLDEARTLAWQRNLGYVPQSVVLADDSVAWNVALDEPDLSAVRRACQQAHVADVVEALPEGYATPLGERGCALSGGQRQRLGIARALYRDPELLILDEATSSLDNLTERALLDTLASLGGSKTIVVIAHRLTTARSCDSIAVLDDGRVIARGTYSELLETCPLFAELVGAEPACVA